jgi:hypothetical protein
MEPRGFHGESGWVWMIACRHWGAVQFTQDSRPGLLSAILVQISFSDRLILIAVVKNKSAIGQIAISPVGTAENSPGRSPG